jgi:hypothetical protein
MVVDKNKLCAHIKVRRLKEKKSTRCPVHKDDATKLLDAATGDLRLLLIFLFHQGWRIGDTLRLTWRDIDLDAGLVTYRISKTNDCLNSPLADAVIEAFRARPNRVGRVFPWRNHNAVYRALQPLCETAGVPFTPHRARALFRDLAGRRRGLSEGDYGGWYLARLSLGPALHAGRYPSRAGDHEPHKTVQTPCRRFVSHMKSRVRHVLGSLFPRFNARHICSPVLGVRSSTDAPRVTPSVFDESAKFASIIERSLPIRFVANTMNR